jgi:hypothetical protein
LPADHSPATDEYYLAHASLLVAAAVAEVEAGNQTLLTQPTLLAPGDEVLREYDVYSAICVTLLLPYLSESYPSRMATIVEVKKLRLDLLEKERAVLAANLLESLPGVLWNEDEGIAEALRRDAEIEASPEQAISLAHLDSHIQSRRS